MFKQGGAFFLFYFLNFLLLSSCGYHFQNESFLSKKISIPYVVGDHRGLLTASLIRQASACGNLQVVSKGERLLLKVELIEDEQDYVGFRFDQKPISGKLISNLIPIESRRSIKAAVTLWDTIEDKALLGPENIQAHLDFDYVDGNSLQDLTFVNTKGEREKVLSFSLGQLDSIEGAQDATASPLFHVLAKKIIDRLLAYALFEAEG